MKFLIPTEPDDTHALLVKLALEEKGHLVRLLFTADQPTKQTNSVYMDNRTYYWKSSDELNLYDDNDYDVVWWRRARKPHLPKELAHPADYQFVVRENHLFYESIMSNLAPSAWWINNKEASLRANFKLLQLRLASECGLSIPKTLCSNNPSEIKMFLVENHNQEVIYKPLSSVFWFEKDKLKMTYTNKIFLSQVKNNNLLQLVPGIYQTEIKKQYELRVTCFGRYLVAARLDSQSEEGSKLDWRAMPGVHLDVQPYKLPTILELRIQQFMDKLGIVFGSFDFIVTPEGDYVFLEVNEQGQFLWVEDYNSDIKMLDTFIQFITQGSKDFQWDPNRSEHTLRQYKDLMQEQLDFNMSKHVFLNGITLT